MGKYFTGLSTEYEVKLLMETYGDAEPGTLIKYESICNLIGVQRGTHRFRGIMAQWKGKMIGQENLYLHAIINEGYKVMTAQERIEAGVDGVISIRKKSARTVHMIATTSRAEMQEEEKIKADHMQMILNRLHDSVVSASQNISLPKPKPPADSILYVKKK